jgi:bisanhydrobacterioruberin hydratase
MERQNYLAKYGIIAAVYIIFGVGAVGHLISSVRSPMISITPFVLLAMGLLVLYFPVKQKGRPLVYWICGIYLVTFFLEAIGVATGKIFGNYIYGSSLGFRIFDVPLIIGFNWVVVILGSIALASRITKAPVLRVIFTAIVAVIFDSIIEPAAIRLDYWQWEAGSIPLQNYAVWFIIALAAASVFVISGLQTTSRELSHYLIAQLSFFVVLNVFL